MAMTYDRASQVAKRVQSLADVLKALRRTLVDVLAYNADQAIDWTADPIPPYLQEDTNGNLLGYDFDRAAVANMIGSADAINNFLDQGHMDNVNVMAKADA